MFIRKKIVRGTTFYQVVECRRIDGKVRQMVVQGLAQHPTVRGLIGSRVAELRWAWRELLFCPSHEMPLSRRRGRTPERIRQLQQEVRELAELSSKLGDPVAQPARVYRDPTDYIPTGEATDAAGFKWLVAQDAKPERLDVGEAARSLGWTRHKVRMARYVAAWRNRGPDYNAVILWGSLTIDDAFGRVARDLGRGRPESRYPVVDHAPAFVLRAEWGQRSRQEQEAKMKEYGKFAMGL